MASIARALPAKTAKAAKAKATADTDTLPEGMDPKNATEAAVWRALPAHGTAIVDCPNVQTMAGKVGLSESQAGKMLKRLVDAGHAVADRHGRQMRYARSGPAADATPAAEPEATADAQALDAAVAGLSPFANQAEAQAYAALHAGGRAALESFVGGYADALLDRWAQAKLIRIKDVDGGPQVTSFAKYAKASVPTEPYAGATPIVDVPAQPAESDAEAATDPWASEDGQAPADTVSEALAALEGEAAKPVSAPPADVAPVTDLASRLTETEARTLTADIRGRVAEVLPMIVRAFHGRADLALGYANWAAYCDAELAGLRMPVTTRRQAVKSLTDVAGMSTRAVAAALNVSEGTVRRDLTEAGGADPQREIKALDGKTYDAGKQGQSKGKAAKVAPGSMEGDGPRTVPAEATETGTCIHCNWAIGRSLTRAGSRWTHKDGKTECAEFPGHHAEPVVQDVSPAGDVDAALADLEDATAQTLGATGVTSVSFADDSQVIAGGRPVTDVPATGAGTYSADAGILPGLDTEAMAIAIAEFDWQAYDITRNLGPLPAKDQPVTEFPEWITDLAEHIANALGR